MRLPCRQWQSACLSPLAISTYIHTTNNNAPNYIQCSCIVYKVQWMPGGLGMCQGHSKAFLLCVPKNIPTKYKTIPFRGRMSCSFERGDSAPQREVLLPREREHRHRMYWIGPDRLRSAQSKLDPPISSYISPDEAR